MDNFIENYRNAVNNMKAPNSFVEKAMQTIKKFENNLE